MEARFKPQRLLGQGSYGRAYLAIDKETGQKVVLKQFFIQRHQARARKLAIAECELLSELSHPNIVGYLGHAVDRESITLILEYADRGDVSELIGLCKDRVLSEEFVIDVAFQLLKAVAYIHRRNILHRDIKCSNILLGAVRGSSHCRVMLADFGVSKVLAHPDEMADSLTGTPYYLSPEVCNGKPYGRKSDMWAVGIVLYEMMMKTTPFRGRSVQVVSAKVNRGIFGEITGPYSDELKDICYSLLRNDPEERPDAEALLTLPIFQRHCESYVIGGDEPNPIPNSSPIPQVEKKSQREEEDDPMNRTPTEPGNSPMSAIRAMRKPEYHKPVPMSQDSEVEGEGLYVNNSAIERQAYRDAKLAQLICQRTRLVEAIGEEQYKRLMRIVPKPQEGTCERKGIDLFLQQEVPSLSPDDRQALGDHMWLYITTVSFAYVMQ
ncbi:Kinase, NEK [Giardia muris]|uniref:non-specific serine/threonine protein kinase n=1 Tax=Giardia muris TaxID=5742 RepID=A0A4Z1T1S6_GIAMU|nr:Kinase, NEK [Giardia muris]|eukprot:TNJ26509.1 Kinase, NEK [Giardia muris]